MQQERQQKLSTRSFFDELKKIKQELPNRLQRHHGKPITAKFSGTNSYQYHPTSDLMQILHFDWLRYQWSNSNSQRIAKFATFSSVPPPPPKRKIFLQLIKLGDTKTIRPFALKGHGSIAHLASPHGLLTRSPFGLQI